MVYTDPETGIKYPVAYQSFFKKRLKDDRLISETAMTLKRCYGLDIYTKISEYTYTINNRDNIEIYRCENMEIIDVLKLIKKTRIVDPEDGVDMDRDITRLDGYIMRDVVRDVISRHLLTEDDPNDKVGQEILDYCYMKDHKQIKKVWLESRSLS